MSIIILLFLLPPSEGKNIGGVNQHPQRTFSFDLPLDLAQAASEKDLKCKETRYKEALVLNTEIKQGPWLPTIQRYSGVMFNAIDYVSMTPQAQVYFDKHVLLVSGLYGLLRPQDMIANYKLPIGARGLYRFWGDRVQEALLKYSKAQGETQIVDLLPQAHKKLFDWDALRATGISITTVDFVSQETGKRLTHGVKKVKGAWLHDVCRQGGTVIDFQVTTHRVLV